MRYRMLSATPSMSCRSTIAFRRQLSSLTWNAGTIIGKLSMPVLTPDEWLRQQMPASSARLHAIAICPTEPAMPRDFLKDAKDEYDVVVIGSGLAGLTAANVLGRAGPRVLLLEQHYKLGGMATWFKRPGGHIFDISLHGFPHGMVKSCRRYWTQEIADSIVQLKHIRFDNPMFSLTTTFNREDFTQLLTDAVRRRRRDACTAFFDTARGMNFYDDQSMTTRRAVRPVLPRPRGRDSPADGADHLRQRLDARRPGDHLRHRVLELHVKGVFTFEGGTDRLIGLMHAELREERRRCADQVRRRARSTVDGGRVRGVEVNGRDDPDAGPSCRNANLKRDDLPPGRRGAFRPAVRRRGPGRAAEQLQHAGLHGAQAGRADRRERRATCCSARPRRCFAPSCC